MAVCYSLSGAEFKIKAWFFYRFLLSGCRSILADRIRWRFPPSTAGEAPYTSAVRWHQPAWCTSDTPTIDRFHWSSQYLACRHLPPGKTCTARLTWRQTSSIPDWLAVMWLRQIANDELVDSLSRRSTWLPLHWTLPRSQSAFWGQWPGWLQWLKSGSAWTPHVQG